ncbi:hypothetical protein CVT24_006378 [Panaeolus cyanescens]|uniref:Uncharacterized protein n=1 Tax=Panaeolus cyanescens TaxID=181874 RepID=A0A409WYE1_9AGAR|nr:hypothetical protein CVT24_006378 [Panaeolus cyanescens]
MQLRKTFLPKRIFPSVLQPPLPSSLNILSHIQPKLSEIPTPHPITIIQPRKNTIKPPKRLTRLILPPPINTFIPPFLKFQREKFELLEARA